jgi:hypothetical protein
VNRHSVLVATIVLMLMPAAGSPAQEKPLKEAIVGAWSLTSVFDEYESGQKNNPFGTGVKGSLMFDSSGRFSQIVIGERQDDMKQADPRRPDALAVAYFGTYTVSEADKIVSMKLERAANSSRDGAELKLTIKSISADALSFVGSPRKDQRGTFSPHLELKRAK